MPQPVNRLLLLVLLAPLWTSSAAAGGRSIPSTPLWVSDWLVVGPLPIGSREGLVDPVWPERPAALIPAAGDSLPSLMGSGGWVHWVPTQGREEVVTFAYEGIDWDGLAQQWGIAGTLCAGLAFGTVKTPERGTYWIETAGVGSLMIDGLRYAGNPYGGEFFRTPVVLDAGSHRVMLRVAGGGPRESHFQLRQAGEPLSLLDQDVTLPDLVADEPLDSWGAAPIVNLSGREVRGASLSFGDGRTIEAVRVSIPPLPPEAILKVPFRVRTARPSGAGTSWHGAIRLAWDAEDAGQGAQPPPKPSAWTFPCSLRVRDRDASRIVTFLSKQDQSVQKYALLPPSEAAQRRAGPGMRVSQDQPGDGRAQGGWMDRYGLILSLHGASVEPQPQVDSYSQKDWAYVVAPTNRRPYGFDWQDWGRVNAIETLDDALSRFPIDPDRVVLAGHSMGGHGTWHVGLAHADRFAALAPSAGWASFGSYVPFTLRRDVASAPPELRTIWERAIAPDNALAFLPNARGVPVFVLHGEKDDNVPVFQGRLLVQRARDEGVHVTYEEVPGMGHWWDRPETPGVDCLDDPRMIAFLKGAHRTSRPDSVFLRSGDLRTCDRSAWIVVDEALHPFRQLEVEARIVRGRDAGFAIRTSGVRALTCDPAGRFASETIRIAIDSDLLCALAGEPASMRLTGRHWRLVKGRAKRSPGESASAQNAPPAWGRPDPGRFRGALKHVFFEPFVLVYGTGGTRETTEAMRRMAVLDAQGWYLRGDGYAPVLPDSAITPEIASTRNLILYAIPGANAVLESIASRLPVRIDGGGIGIGGERYEGPGLAARFASANPRFPYRGIEVVAGTDIRGLELAAAANPCASGSGYPDFVIFDESVRWKGWGGMLAAGFFDRDGRVADGDGDAYFDTGARMRATQRGDGSCER